MSDYRVTEVEMPEGGFRLSADDICLFSRVILREAMVAVPGGVPEALAKLVMNPVEYGTAFGVVVLGKEPFEVYEAFDDDEAFEVYQAFDFDEVFS